MSDSQWPHQPAPSAALASLQTVDEASAELEARLIGIHSDLQLTQTIGLLFVKRQEDLKNCFDQLQDLKYHQQQQRQSRGLAGDQQQEPLPDTVREQLAFLDKEFQEGQNGILGLKGLIDAQLVRTPFFFFGQRSSKKSTLYPTR
jgi:ABC-type transporter Mla subunit MlaD